MESITALGREKTHRTGSWVPFRGKHASYKLLLDNETTLDDFEELTDLWYLQFIYQEKYYLACGCVFDIDVSGPLQQQVYTATRARNSKALLAILAPIFEVIKKEFSGLPFKVFASGSKGLHVYVKNPDGFMITRENWNAINSQSIKNFMESQFSREFLGLIDYSPYAPNKGIRPLRCANPKSLIVPFEVLASDDWRETGLFIEDSWLFWLCTIIRSGGVANNAQDLVVPLYESIVVNQPIVVAGRPLDENSGFYDGPLRLWIQRQSGIASYWNENQQGRFLLYTAEGVSGTWCPIARKIHKTKCTSWDCSFENGVRKATCFNIKCSTKQFILRNPMERPITNPDPEMVPPERITNYPNPNQERYLPGDQFMADIELHKKVVLCAPMGSGKTHSVVQWIEKKGDELQRVLVIGTRIQQIAAWTEKFARLGFKNYETIQGSLYREPRVLVCLNSLPRLLAAPNDDNFRAIPMYDALIIDEADSLARWLGGSLLTESPMIFEILRALIKSSRYTLCMDGIPTRALPEMLEQFQVAAQFRWLTFSSLKFKEWLFVNNHEYFTQSYLKALLAGKRLFFVTNSKTAVFRFLDLAVKVAAIPEEKILAIHGEMARTLRDQSGNPDGWMRFDLMLANGSLGPGASFDHLHFHQVFALVDVKCGVIPAEIAQLVERPRQLINNQVVVMVLKKPYNELLREELDANAHFANRQYWIHSYTQGIRVHCQWRPLTGSDPTPLREEGPPLPIYMDLRHTRDPEMLLRDLEAAIVPPLPSERQSNLATLPAWNHRTDTLGSEIIQGQYGLVFEQTPLVKLQATVQKQIQEAVVDSELFLKKLQEICTLNGAGFTTKGPRNLPDDKGNCRVLGGHMSYLNVLGKRPRNSFLSMPTEGEEPEPPEQPADWQKCQADPVFAQIDDNFSDSPGIADFLKNILYSSTTSITSRLSRLRYFIRNYDGTDACVFEQCRKDVVKLFQVKASEQNQPIAIAATGQFTIRPSSIARVCYNETLTTGELFAMIHVLLSLLQHKMEPGGIITKPASGSFSTLDFYNAPTRQPWWDVVRACVAIFAKEGYSNTFKKKALLNNEQVPTDMGVAHAIVFTHLYSIFEFVGIPLKKQLIRKVVPIRGQRKKTVWHLISLDQKMYDVHLALLGNDNTIQQVLAENFPDLQHQNQ